MKKKGYHNFSVPEDETEAQQMLRKQEAKKKAYHMMKRESDQSKLDHVKFLNEKINETDDEDERERLLRRRDKFMKANN